MRKEMLVGVLVSAIAPLPAAQKPTANPDWTCAIRVYDSYSVDPDGGVVPPDTLSVVHESAIQSDTKGWYTNGLDGVNCRIPQSPNSGLYGWLQVGFSRKVARAFRYPGQSSFDGGYQYASFSTGPVATFEIVRIASVISTEVRPFRASVDNGQFAEKVAAFRGDAEGMTTWPVTGTNSVRVQRVDACSWRVSLGGDGLLELGEGGGYAQYRGHYRMPLLVDVKILSGNGCGGQ